MKLKQLFIICFMLAGFAAQAQTAFNPPIKNFGKVRDVPFAVDKPDPSLEYKIVVEVSQSIDSPAMLYAPLDHIARMYNLHVYGGVPQKQLDVAVVIWGVGIGVTMNNEAYHKKYGVDNPNLKIIAALKEAGIKVFACGQSILKAGMDPKTLNPDIVAAISRFTTVSTYQLKGYAFFQY